MGRAGIGVIGGIDYGLIVLHGIVLLLYAGYRIAFVDEMSGSVGDIIYFFRTESLRSSALQILVLCVLEYPGKSVNNSHTPSESEPLSRNTCIPL